jgi:hypothetical protein
VLAGTVTAGASPPQTGPFKTSGNVQIVDFELQPGAVVSRPVSRVRVLCIARSSPPFAVEFFLVLLPLSTSIAPQISLASRPLVNPKAIRTGNFN